jgi:hypothetical protein
LAVGAGADAVGLAPIGGGDGGIASSGADASSRLVRSERNAAAISSPDW